MPRQKWDLSALAWHVQLHPAGRLKSECEDGNPLEGIKRWLSQGDSRGFCLHRIALAGVQSYEAHGWLPGPCLLLRA